VARQAVFTESIAEKRAVRRNSAKWPIGRGFSMSAFPAHLAAQVYFTAIVALVSA
jgi:hypothetical protein